MRVLYLNAISFAVEMFSLDSRAPLHRKNIVIIFNNLHIIAKCFTVWSIVQRKIKFVYHIMRVSLLLSVDSLWVLYSCYQAPGDYLLRDRPS